MATDADFSLLVDAEGRVLAAGEAVAGILGWDLAKCAAEGLWACVEQDSQRVALRQLLKQAIATGHSRMTLQLPAKAGSLWVDAAAKLIEDESGTAVLIAARDISHDWAASAQLAASELQWRLAFEHSPIGGALLDESGGVLVVNEALCRMTGFRVHELTRMNVMDLLGSEAGTNWPDWWNELLASGTAHADRAIRKAMDEQFYGRLTAATLESPGSGLRVVMQFEDVTSRREAELELANRALNDGLTGAPNRFLTRQWLASALEESRGSGVGVLYCDLDRFKIINDSLGHPAGDDLLVQLVERLRSPLRPEDLLGRVGGDEFVVIIEGVQTPAELAGIAARLSDALAEPFNLAGHLHAVTLSVGGSIGIHPDTADEVLMRADMALLRAKRLGRSRYVAFDPSQDRVATKADLQLEHDLRMSLEAGELRAYYQPIVALEDLHIVGYEALVRWQHPEHGLLPPARFLELAEISGLIRPLGWWMLEQACSDARGGGLLGGSWIAVNASAGQLTRPGVAAAVAEALTVTGLEPSRLHLEITETALLTATETLGRELHELSDMGVKIALDDFGTGYSSLSLLRQFPVDVLKIDRSFVMPLLKDRSAYAIVKAMIGMCSDMGVSTVAEGIETIEQSDALRAMGCSHGQGFLFGHAEPLATRQPLIRGAKPPRGGPATWTESVA